MWRFGLFHVTPEASVERRGGNYVHLRVKFISDLSTPKKKCSYCSYLVQPL